MNLQDQGFRFILRTKGDRVDGYWEQPPIAPGGIDATDLDDEAMAETVSAMTTVAECGTSPR